MQMANDAAAEKPGSAKYRDNLPRHETNICCRRARRDRISAVCRVQRVVTCNDVEHLRIDGAFISAGDYVQAGRRRLETIAAVEQALREVDVLLYAGAMDPPSQIDDAVETERTYPRQARTPFNITGHPALAMMAGLSSGGLPLSVQFVGRYFGEAALFRVARECERAAVTDQKHPPVV